MTTYRVYIGEVIDPALTWDELGDHWQRNVREVRQVDFGLDKLLGVAKLIRDGTLEGRQVDWGAWVADVSKQQLIELYPSRDVGNVSVYRPFMKGMTDDEIIDRMDFDPARAIKKLPDRRYVLVAIEGAD